MISIVMPCYNCETSLVRTAECIRAQTVADWELIAVDDGSSDGTGAALDALARADARIRVIHQENGGVSRARNAGMAAARGEWLAFADADDVLPPDALATLLALDDGGADILCGAYTIRYTDEGGREERLAWGIGRRFWKASSGRTARSIPCAPSSTGRRWFAKRGFACRRA